MTTHPLSIVARILELLLGLLFLAGALLKILDINLFVVQIGAYGIFEDKMLLTMSAFGTVMVEILLGALLVLGFARRFLSIGATLLLLIFLSGLVLYGWAFHDLAECGCFGSIEMTPAVTLLKNLVMMVMGLIAWWGLTLTPKHIGMPKYMQLNSGLAWSISLLISLAGGAYAYQNLERVEDMVDEDGEVRPFARFVLNTEQGELSLGTGEHLVVFLSADCAHCKAEVPALNELVFDDDLPPLVGLCFEDTAGELDRFEMDALPMFPLYSLGNQVMLFFSFIGQAPPRLYYIVDGRSVHHWDLDMPSIETVRDVVLQD